MHACLAQLDQHQSCKPVMVSVVSSNPSGGNFIFLRHLDANFVQKSQICQICVIYENLVCQCTMKHNKQWIFNYLHIQDTYFVTCPTHVYHPFFPYN